MGAHGKKIRDDLGHSHLIESPIAKPGRVFLPMWGFLFCKSFRLGGFLARRPGFMAVGMATFASAALAGDAAQAMSTQAGGLPGLRRLIDSPLRDTSIEHGPDGMWYMIGTVEPFWAYNESIKLWKSPDLTNRTALGFVWKYGESPWHKPYLEKKKPFWAPEVHFPKGTFCLAFSSCTCLLI